MKPTVHAATKDKVPSQQLPDQYPRRVHYSDTIDHSDHSNYEHYGQYLNDSDDDTARSGHMLRTCRDDPTTEFHAYASRSYDGCNHSISDSGADSLILGSGCTFTEKSLRTVTVLGFDASCTRKPNCPIGTATTVMNDINGIPYLIIAPESVQNINSNTSLLSELKMQSFGVIVDSTSKRHTLVNGTPGTQCLRIPCMESTTSQGYVTIHLQLRHGQMCAKHRTPSGSEHDNLPRLYITSSDMWQPQMLEDTRVQKFAMA